VPGLSLQAPTSESNNGPLEEVDIYAVSDRLLQGSSPVQFETCPASRAQCSFSPAELTPVELDVFQNLGSVQEFQNTFQAAQTAQLVFDWMKVTLKGTGPNSCVPAPVALANFAFAGLPFDILNPLFYVEILVAGPCETFKPRVDILYFRLNNLYKAANLLAKIPKIGPVFSKVAKFFKRPVDALEELRDAMKNGCKKVSKTRQYARKTLEILNHVGTASGIIGSLMDFYLISLCNQANENAGTARLRAAHNNSDARLRVRGLQENEVDIELKKQAQIIRDRTEVITAVYNFAQDFNETLAPVLNELKAVWDRVEQELEEIFDGIEDVIEIFAPFQEIIDVLGQIDCSEVPFVSYGKLAFSLIAF
jgi:hypothetical protein